MLYAITDGSCQPNPHGVCACAFIIKNNKSKVIYKFSKRIGAGIGYTNNVGEYTALLEVLRWFSSNEEKELTIASDSKLVINQMNGKWKVNGGAYYEVYLRAKGLAASLIDEGKVLRYNWVPREYTLEADSLANKAISGKETR